jgi:hypothetical protein
VPDYWDTCAVALDSTPTCLRLALAAIDRSRRQEGLGPMMMPADLGRLSAAEQVFVALDRERVDRGLQPFAGMTLSLDHVARQGADAGNLPRAGGNEAAEWLGGVINGLDADYQWLYDDGPGGGVPGCSSRHRSTCWADRQILLAPASGAGTLVMGVAINPTADTSRGDRGGTSLALVVDATRTPGPFAYTWAEALTATAAGTLSPLERIPAHASLSDIPDPTHNVAPVPDYVSSCAPEGTDSSPSCIAATLAAIDHAHDLEGVRPMVVPTDFAHLTVAEQIFVAIDLERVDRGLAPFVGLTAALDRNAARGARKANDPPDPGAAYVQSDTEWAGGSSNGLDAVYGWMYYDGYRSGNLDCLRPHASGCWGHRLGILDDFGTGGTLEMGAAFDPHGDDNTGDRGGPSMAATLTVTYRRPGPFVYTWAEARADIPGGAGE